MPLVSYHVAVCEWPPPCDPTPDSCRSTILQQQFNRAGKVEHGSVALPAVMRSGSGGPETFNMGSMPSPQQQVVVGQMHRGHMPPLVSRPPRWHWASVGCLGCVRRDASLGELACTVTFSPVPLRAVALCCMVPVPGYSALSLNEGS